MELLKSLFENAELPADFQEKTKTLFEAAVAESLKSEVAALQESFDAKLAESKEAFVAESVALIDSVVEETVLEWAKENAIPLDNQIKGQIAESFLQGLKGLYESADIELKGDTAAGSKIAELQEQAAAAAKAESEAKQALAEAHAQLVQIKTKQIIASITEGLADTVAHRVASLCEAFEFKTEEDFTAKANMVLEAVTGKIKGTQNLDGTTVAVDGGAAPAAKVDTASGSEPAPEVVQKPTADSAAPLKGDDHGKPVENKGDPLKEAFDRQAAEYAPHLNADLVSETLKLFK